jgi:hypothetical protein
VSEPREKPFATKVIDWMVVFVFVVVLFAMALPIYFSDGIGNRKTNTNITCINNLRQLDAAANQFALEQNKTNGAPIHFPDDLTPYIKLNAEGKIPPCPAGGIYTIKQVGDIPTCSLGSAITPPHILP